ncbi:hypothetical protein [Shimwellia blattae]|uniref:Surface antigen domain protein n=1 Tax=Shimwellia blattae (strain ATCC 29907 / DSM 4481 / JCM 1650 / NBRC 105725 / CDC 9005-74) TaxID=630626 RepID=I2BAC6_SHIBC|nr:hypothetical protein [Shimwellia blattae]AFJ47480.1 surface antigen domain protein [Shimwellia blattae DSM 4481 = NBRC 105725]GAB80329.1 hypothetical protein YcfJ [Shimwellia blattae DSM 4481 = NBRC 105725]VDY64977.1 Uncharacterised protein [Shimwellia blattae]VEC23255.1 Uncharacterised protein [Shimwellia blattae]
MNQTMLAGVGIVAALGLAATASLTVFSHGPQFAQVVAAVPITETITTPRKICSTVVANPWQPPAEGDPAARQRCKIVYDKTRQQIGYNVTYRIANQQGKIRMDRNPGSRIPLNKEGQLVLERQ